MNTHHEPLITHDMDPTATWGALDGGRVWNILLRTTDVHHVPFGKYVDNYVTGMLMGVRG